MKTWVWIVIIIAVVVIALVALMAMSRRRSAGLQQRFGPEYERTLQNRDDRRAAEADLRGREKERARLDIRPIPEATRTRFAQQWVAVQEQFVDQPATAVIGADSLLHQVMALRGYPMENFEANADLVSVDHPQVVDNYRSAHATFERAQTQQASTEELRQAFVSYRALFDDLLRSDEHDATDPSYEDNPAGGSTR
jgi:FtsZ-interacting cell division protein ZipA